MFVAALLLAAGMMTLAFAQTAAIMTSPTSPSTLSGSSVTFQWSAASGASGYWLDVGTAEYGNTIYQSGTLSNTVLIWRVFLALSSAEKIDGERVLGH